VRPPEGARVVSIGPITSATAQEHGLTVHVEAERHDVEGLVDALTRDAAARRVPARSSRSSPTTAATTTSSVSATA
jgi:hypothetical protein